MEQMQKDLKRYVIDEVLKGQWIDEKTNYLVNPTGRFVIGGPHGDSGFDGSQEYCGYLWRILSSWRRCILRKRLPKVDRSASYAADGLQKILLRQDLQKKM